MRWIDSILIAFEELDGLIHYSDIYNYIENNSDRDLPTSWKAIIRKEVEYHSSDSDAFLGKEDYFFSVGEKGNGKWGLRTWLIEEPKAFDSEEYPEAIKELREVYRFIRDSQNAIKLKLLYGNSCQICGLRISLGNRYYSEAHHLQPLGGEHAGPDDIRNILILCPNHHVEMDYGAIGINPKSKKIVHVDSTSRINGFKLFIHQAHQLDPPFLDYHFQNIFQLLLTSK